MCSVDKMKSLIVVLNEQIENKRMIFNLTKYELKSRYAGNALGILWLFLNPIIQIGIFWFVFGVGIRGGAPVDGIPFIVWLQTGMIPWFFISAGISQGATSISSKLSVASKMNFPLSIVPAYVILAQLQTHLILLSLVFLIMIVHGVSFAGFSILALLYFILTTTIFLMALSFVTSTIISIVKDARQLIQHIVRFTFFMTPIMWETPRISNLWFQIVLRANPVYYLVMGYRNAFLFSNVRSINLIDTIYFWSFTIFLMTLGMRIHIKFRREFIDYL